MSHDPTEAVGKLASLVPSVYYDVIARIIPGTLFLLFLEWRGVGLPFGIATFGEFGKWFFFLVAGYAAGMILTGLSNVFDLIWLGICRKFCGAVMLGEGKAESIHWKYSPNWVNDVAGRVSAIDKAAGDTLGKMFAEVTLCENLILGLIIAWFIPSYKNYTWWIWGIILTLFVIALIFRVVSTAAAAEGALKNYLSDVPDKASRLEQIVKDSTQRITDAEKEVAGTASRFEQVVKESAQKITDKASRLEQVVNESAQKITDAATGVNNAANVVAGRVSSFEQVVKESAQKITDAATGVGRVDEVVAKAIEAAVAKISQTPPK